MPRLTRSSLHRCRRRHGISRLPEIEGEKRSKKKFKDDSRMSGDARRPSFRPGGWGCDRHRHEPRPSSDRARRHRI